MRIEALSKSNIADFLSLFNEGTCKDCYCTALYASSWDSYEPQSPGNRERRISLIEEGNSDGYLFYNEQEVAGWVQVAKTSDLPNLRNTSTYFQSHPGLAITCFKLRADYRNKGLSTLMVKLIVEALAGTDDRLYAIPSRYSDEFNEYRSWTGTTGCFSRNGFIEIEKGFDDYVVMGLPTAEQGAKPDASGAG
jgi:hypothetical protein